MICGYVGTPGSGKSYEAVLKILDNLRIGKFKKIYTNIEGLDNPKCLEHIRQQAQLTDYQLATRLEFLSADQVDEFWLHIENSSLIVLDEVHKHFSNRDWASDKNKGFTEWLSTHRHQGCDVVLITQDIEKIDKHARSLIEWTYLFRKVNFFGGMVSKKYLCYAYAGDDHNGKALSTNPRTYKQSVFRCYKSFDDAEIKELGFMKHVNILKHPVFFIIPIMFVILGSLFMSSSFSKGKIFTPLIAEVAPVLVDDAPGSAKKEDNLNPKVSEIETAPGVDPLPLPPVVDEQIKMYITASGNPVWTNTGRPPGARYIRTL